MARPATRNTQYLEQKNGIWRVSVAVPAALVAHFGKTRLKRSLGTDSLAMANRSKQGVVAELKAEIEAARRNSLGNPVLRHAIVLAEARKRSEHAGDTDRENDISAEINETIDHLLGKPIDSEQGPFDAAPSPVYDPKREREAKLFAAVATGRATPIGTYHQTFIDQQDTKRRTKADDERSVAYLIDWCSRNNLPATIETITKRRASQFMDDLPKLGGKRSPVTLNKYLRRLSVYWQWLAKRDHAASNVWQGMVLKQPKRLRSEEERPFTVDELKKLLAGPTTQAMHDLMRIAALTGARLDPIVDLKVRDCKDGKFRFKPQKSEADSREVPIHSALTAIIARRTANKPDNADVFPEWPAPSDPKSLRERSFKASNAFTDYRREIGVTEELAGRRRSLVNFHSFRRSFITMAEQAGIPETTIRSVVGHKREGMTFGVYSQGPSIEQLKACVEAVKLPAIRQVVIAPGRPHKARRKGRTQLPTTDPPVGL